MLSSFADNAVRIVIKVAASGKNVTRPGDNEATS